MSMKGETMADSTYYTNLLIRGAIKHRNVTHPVGVIDSLFGGLPIGVATCVGKDENGLAVWILAVNGERIPGLWVIVDRKFRPSEWEANGS
jgi:hypothetical protein